jgi:hypothetical protein
MGYCLCLEKIILFLHELWHSLPLLRLFKFVYSWEFLFRIVDLYIAYTRCDLLMIMFMHHKNDNEICFIEETIILTAFYILRLLVYVIIRM